MSCDGRFESQKDGENCCRNESKDSEYLDSSDEVVCKPFISYVSDDESNK